MQPDTIFSDKMVNLFGIVVKTHLFVFRCPLTAAVTFASNKRKMRNEESNKKQNFTPDSEMFESSI
jgi:hypothetical protein